METHEKIRVLRELNKWTQEETAEKLGISAGGYARIERGEVKPNTTRLAQLASVFQVEIWELLRSEKNDVIFQINEGDSSGDISLHISSHSQLEFELLKREVTYYKDLVLQKDKQISLLEKLLETLQKNNT